MPQVIIEEVGKICLRTNKAFCEIQVTFEQVAKICHQANKAFCEVNGDFSQVDWEDASDDDKEQGIIWTFFAADMLISGKISTAKDLFEMWKETKIEQGYTYGPVKDHVKKTNPCIVEYEQYPEFQRMHIELLFSIVKTFL